MNNATISADIISYTALKERDRRYIENKINKLLSEFTGHFKEESFYGRLIQGDYIECAIDNPVPVLRIALLLKCYVKSIQLERDAAYQKQIRHFNEHAIRVAIAVAPLSEFNPEKGIIDGQAIYLSGRGINKHKTAHKQRVIIKNTMFFFCNDETEQNKYDTMITLLDTIITRSSARQCEVIYHKLMGLNENEISIKLNKDQSTISQHSNAGGWGAIEKTVRYFENNI